MRGWGFKVTITRLHQSAWCAGPTMPSRDEEAPTETLLPPIFSSQEGWLGSSEACVHSRGSGSSSDILSAPVPGPTNTAGPAPDISRKSSSQSKEKEEEDWPHTCPCSHTHAHAALGCHFEPNCFSTSCHVCGILLWHW